jgi:hypothetical protein
MNKEIFWVRKVSLTGLLEMTVPMVQKGKKDGGDN